MVKNNNMVQFEKSCANLNAENLRYAKAVAEALKFSQDMTASREKQKSHPA